MAVKMVAFTSCGHCPLAIVKLHGKCKPMDVYCPLQFTKEGKYERIYQTFKIDELHPGCPLPSDNDWSQIFARCGTNEEREKIVEETRFLNLPGSSSENVKYSVRKFKRAIKTRSKRGR